MSHVQISQKSHTSIKVNMSRCHYANTFESASQVNSLLGEFTILYPCCLIRKNDEAARQKWSRQGWNILLRLPPIRVEVRDSFWPGRWAPLVTLLRLWFTWRDEEEPDMVPLPDEMWALAMRDDSWARWPLRGLVLLREVLLPDLLPSVMPVREVFMWHSHHR